MIKTRNMDKKTVPLLIAVSLAFSQKGASAKVSEDIVERQTEHRSDTRSWFSGIYHNPAMQWNRYRYSLNRLSATYDNSHATVPQQLEYGDKVVAVGGDIDAFLRKKKVSLWGTAHYGNSKTHHVCYNETTDFDLLYPYVMADTIGGGVSRKETYDFLGGFAYHKRRWTVGVEGRYTARLEYRTVDPRPKNLTGYLKVKAGTAYSGLFNGTYEGGASVGFQRYKQTNILEFYNETSQPTVYQLTGLGMDYYRFRGSNTSTYYKGLGWNATIGLHPSAPRNGIYASLDYSSLSIDKVISDLNELPLTKLKLQQQTLEMGYMHKGRINTWGIRVAEACDERRGIENIFGSAQDNIYPQIASGRQYQEVRWNLSAGLLWQYRPSDKSVYDIFVNQCYRHIQETYASPWRKMASSAQVSALSLKGMWQIKRWILQTSAYMDYVWNSRCDMVLTGSINESMMAPVYNRYAFYKNNRYETRLQAEANYAMSHNYSVFVAATWGYAHYMKTEHNSFIRLSLGMEF